jgi:hypothetical protein
VTCASASIGIEAAMQATSERDEGVIEAYMDASRVASEFLKF